MIVSLNTWWHFEILGSLPHIPIGCRVLKHFGARSICGNSIKAIRLDVSSQLERVCIHRYGWKVRIGEASWGILASCLLSFVAAQEGVIRCACSTFGNHPLVVNLLLVVVTSWAEHVVSKHAGLLLLLLTYSCPSILGVAAWPDSLSGVDLLSTLIIERIALRVPWGHIVVGELGVVMCIAWQSRVFVVSMAHLVVSRRLLSVIAIMSIAIVATRDRISTVWVVIYVALVLLRLMRVLVI